MIFLESKEPIFATGTRRKGKYIVYLDCDGLPACINFYLPNSKESGRFCQLCGNAVVHFIVDDSGQYICSACGKFPRELIQNLS